MQTMLKAQPQSLEGFPVNQRLSFQERLINRLGDKLSVNLDGSVRPMRVDEIPDADEKRRFEAALRDGNLAEVEAECDFYENVLKY